MATIWIVDDDYVIRNLLKQVLTLNKHNVVEASTLNENSTAQLLHNYKEKEASL
jgi:DNA-binding NtrC family response regulator